MKFPLEKEVYIRLADYEPGFVCTRKFCRFFSTAASFSLKRQPECQVGVQLPSQRVTRWPRSLLGPSDSD